MKRKAIKPSSAARIMTRGDHSPLARRNSPAAATRPKVIREAKRPRTAMIWPGDRAPVAIFMSVSLPMKADIAKSMARMPWRFAAGDKEARREAAC